MYIEDGRKMLKFAQRISASYLLYAMNKLRLSAYLCTPSGNPKLCLGSVCPFCAIFPKPGGRSRLFALKRKASIAFGCIRRFAYGNNTLFPTLTSSERSAACSDAVGATPSGRPFIVRTPCGQFVICPYAAARRYILLNSFALAS